MHTGDLAQPFPIRRPRQLHRPLGRAPRAVDGGPARCPRPGGPARCPRPGGPLPTGRRRVPGRDGMAHPGLLHGPVHHGRRQPRRRDHRHRRPQRARSPSGTSPATASLSPSSRLPWPGSTSGCGTTPSAEYDRWIAMLGALSERLADGRLAGTSTGVPGARSQKGSRADHGYRSQPAEPPRWVTTRVAHPVRDLVRSEAFYRDLLGLRSRGGFTGHDGYDGAFFALPGGGELELTTGPAEPRPGTEEDLLVLYLRSLEEVRRTAADLERAGVPSLNPANPYWARWGRTFLDPDDNAVVIAAVPPDPITTGPVRVERFSGSRDELRGLFELAEDSADAARLLLPRRPRPRRGRPQRTSSDTCSWSTPAEPGQVEIKNMAVRAELQGRGVGALLVQAAVDLLRPKRSRRSWRSPPRPQTSATCASTSGRASGCGPSSATPSPPPPATRPGSAIDGIELRDRVWLDYPITGALPR